MVTFFLFHNYALMVIKLENIDKRTFSYPIQHKTGAQWCQLKYFIKLNLCNKLTGLTVLQ